MAKASSEIKTIIQPAVPLFAAFLPDTAHDIGMRIVPVVCLSLVTFDNEDPDEVIGQIVASDAIVEVTYVDEEEGFGKFLGYYPSEETAKVASLAAIAEGADDEEEPEDEGADEDEDDDEEPDDGEDLDEEDDDDDEDEDDDEDDDDDDEDDD